MLWLTSLMLNIDSSHMTSISGPWYKTLTEPMLLFSGLQQELMVTGSDYSLTALPVSLSLPTTSSLKLHCTNSCKAFGVLAVSHISSMAKSTCYGYLSLHQLWQPVQSNPSLLNETVPIWPLMLKLPRVALETFLCLQFNEEICTDFI